MYTKQQFSKLIDHTMLKPPATRDDVIRFCQEGKDHHFAAVVVFPSWVPVAVQELAGTDVKVCTTIGFPHGSSTRATKVYEARNAVTNGAEELDVVINVGALKSKDLEYVSRELTDIIGTAQMSGMTQDAKRTLFKVIIETPFLTREEKITACKIARDAGADFIKTSTGTAPNGATVEDVQLIRDVVGPSIGVKAAGGIRTIEHAMDLLDAGANRLGTSTGVALVQAYIPEELLKQTK
ncbi:MAG: deoxyribose-phosphate aldolase [Armatimonadota bacterium]